MLVIIYTILISYMFFFTTCIAPVINVSLNKQNASKLLRRIFPKNFKFGLAVSVIAILISIFEKNLTSFFLSLVLFIFFLINLYYVMPKINDIADEDKKKNTYSKKFKKLHFLSVSVYLLQMILSILGIIICY
ncbi:MAG: hypothetical protein CMJ06_00890 [Pelagibacterales bacterium]|nr:hypothetical protein [Pelagibacterales bacterium]OUU63423.1 MAG: hypothetical protein CBC22_00860 [Alphaproteobacteria bacterium TMED62]